MFDLHLLIQTIIYLLICVLGLVVSICVGVSRMRFNGKCMLYAEMEWGLDGMSFNAKYSPDSSCDFPIYLSVFGCIFYALGVGIYNAFATYKSKQDQHIPFQMWVWPFVLINSIVAFLVLISSCMISVGTSLLCSELVKGKVFTGCADAQDKEWPDRESDENINTGYFYNMLEVAQAAAWITLVLWFIQIGLGALRILRNRRMRSNQKDVNGDKATIVQNDKSQTNQSKY